MRKRTSKQSRAQRRRARLRQQNAILARTKRIVWKKAFLHLPNGECLKEVLVKLYIPHGTDTNVVERAATLESRRKLRAACARVLGFEHLRGGVLTLAPGYTVRSGYDSSYIYEVGKTVRPVGWSPRRKLLSRHFQACEEGIHFFLRRHWAAQYLL